MDPTTPIELESTGTLPIQGTAVPASAETPSEAEASTPSWVTEAREGLTVPGKYLAFEDGDRQQVVPVQREWTRIGRSLAADVRFDDATVSRRHALVVHQADGTRVLDDRSLNGVYVNGRRVEWSPLTDGDQIVVGRHTLFFLDTATVGSPVATASQRRDRRVDRAIGCAAAMAAATIAVLSLKGGTGKTTTVRTLADVFRRLGPRRARGRPRPAGQPVGLLRRPAGRVADRRRRPRRQGEGQGGDPRRRHARLADPRRGRALAERQDGPRARPAQGAQGRAQDATTSILIDCPPALGLLTVNGLVAADWALISSEAQYFALQGVEGALEVVEQAKEYYNDDLEWLGVVLNIADMRTMHSREAFASLKEHFGDKVFDTVIRSSIAYAESAERAKSILDHRPDLGRGLPLARRRDPRTGSGSPARAGSSRR